MADNKEQPGAQPARQEMGGTSNINPGDPASHQPRPEKLGSAPSHQTQPLPTVSSTEELQIPETQREVQGKGIVSTVRSLFAGSSPDQSGGSDPKHMSSPNPALKQDNRQPSAASEPDRPTLADATQPANPVAGAAGMSMAVDTDTRSASANEQDTATKTTQSADQVAGNTGKGVAPAVPLRRQPAVWEERDPDDPAYAVSAVDARELTGVTGWRIAGASRRGKMHAHEGKYREDAWHAGVSRKGSWNILAVADGGGSYSLSRVGSHVAVSAAVDALSKNLPEQEFLDVAICGAFTEALNRAYAALDTKAKKLTQSHGKQIDVRDLSTTLLLLACCPSQGLVGVAQVGDGLLVVQKGDGAPLKLIDGDNGEVAGATIFLNNVRDLNWNSRIKLYKLSQMPRLLAAMTDGVADDVLENEQNFQVLFDALAHFIRESKPADAISNWLTYEKRGSFDDRTIVVIYPSLAEQRL